MGLKQQVVKGVSWNIVEQLICQVSSIGVTFVLARILTPNDYGLVALSTVFVGFVYMFENLAMGSALIQRSNINDTYISTSFWTSVSTGILLAFALFIIAPFAARYYDQRLLAYLIAISALNLFITPLGSTHKYLLIKKLEFGKLSLINILTAISGGVVSLILAFVGFGVWSLVLGGLVAGLVVTPLIWYFEKWRPRFVFDKSSFKDLFGFSSYLLTFDLFNYFARNFDNLIVGKILGANALGIYSMAYTLMMKPLQQISWSVTKVLFPAYSSIQGDISRIRSAQIEVVRGISIITFPMMAGLIMVSREFILVVMGPKWEGVILPLQVLCLVGALQSIGTTVGAIFNSQGRSDLQLKVGVVASVGHIIGFIICVRWGLMGLVKGYLATNIIFFFFNQHFAGRLIQLPMIDFLLAMKLPTITSIIMALVLFAYKQLITIYFHLNIFANLVSSISLGVIVYIAFTLLFAERKQIEAIKDILRRRMKTSAQSDNLET